MRTALGVLLLAALAGCKGVEKRRDWNRDLTPLSEVLAVIPKELQAEAIPPDDGWEILATCNQGPWDEALLPARDKFMQGGFSEMDLPEARNLRDSLSISQEKLTAFEKLGQRKVIPPELVNPRNRFQPIGDWVDAVAVRRNAFVIQRVNSWVYLREGKPQEAAKTLANSIRVSDVLSRSVNSNMQHDALNRLRVDGVVSLYRFAAAPKVTEEAILALLKELPEDTSSGFRRALKSLLSLEQAPLLCAKENETGIGPTILAPGQTLRCGWDFVDRLHPRPLDQKKTINLMVPFVQRMLRDSESFYPARQKDFDAKVAEIQKGLPILTLVTDLSTHPKEESEAFAKSCLTMDNPRGRAHAVTILNALSFSFRREYQILSLRQVMRIVLALKAYELRHKKLPAQLNDLVKDKILPTIQLDLMSGKPYRYDAAKRKIWSVGVDGIDQGGKEPGLAWGRTLDWATTVP